MSEDTVFLIRNGEPGAHGKLVFTGNGVDGLILPVFTDRYFADDYIRQVLDPAWYWVSSGGPELLLRYKEKYVCLDPSPGYGEIEVIPLEDALEVVG